jgi:hypothetical protein
MSTFLSSRRTSGPVPLLVSAEAFTFLELTSLSLRSARLAGMAVDLKLTVGKRYSIITLVFFVPYSQFPLLFTSSILAVPPFSAASPPKRPSMLRIFFFDHHGLQMKACVLSSPGARTGRKC